MKSEGIHKTRPYRCPVCNKRQLYAMVVQIQAQDSGDGQPHQNRVAKCKNCAYTNQHEI